MLTARAALTPEEFQTWNNVHGLGRGAGLRAGPRRLRFGAAFGADLLVGISMEAWGGVSEGQGEERTESKPKLLWEYARALWPDTPVRGRRDLGVKQISLARSVGNFN